jgi:signal transduction histidine kinase
VSVTPAPSLPPLRRHRGEAVIGGVCAALARRLGVDALLLRVAFVAAAAAGGTGAAIYLVFWLFIPADAGGPARRRLPLARRDAWQVAGGIAFLVLAALLSLRGIGVWTSDAVVWPLVLAAAGGALIWRQSASAPPVAASEPRRRLPVPARGRVGLGAALVVGAGFIFLASNDALQPARDVVLSVLVVLVALGLILTPWWVRLVRGLTEERTERIRSQERAELAAHLHDSVLQTLALMQRRADDPREVATLARRQERELRAWLNRGGRPGSPGSLAEALEAAAAEVEETHAVPVEVVAVGDAPLDEHGEALVAATREAIVNAAKFAGDGGPVSVYAEVGADRAQVFVRDRGAGFDPAAVPEDRRGVRESIVGRMERHGGSAVVHAAPGGGTEVELVLGRDR